MRGCFAMKILMISWEFPPRSVGGIARHVQDLSEALVRAGHAVTVLTADAPESPEFENVNGVKVWRSYAGTPQARDFLTWVMQLNFAMLQRAFQLWASGERYEIIHVHDWLGAYTGKVLKHAWHLPLLSTIHATEWGRNNGLHNDLQRYISDVEWWLAYESWQVICCSQYMRSELMQVFQIPGDKLSVIPNGVYPEAFRSGPAPEELRWRFAAPDEKVIFHVGRLVREKGLDVLIDALPHVLAQRSNTKLIIAGKGPHAEALANHAREAGIENRIYFTGYIDDATRNGLYRLADVAVFPSLYEPFGIVALEAMAAGTPVIVSDCGGISEVVEHRVTGLKFATGNPKSLAEQILYALDHPEEMEQIRMNAQETVMSDYNWDDIAKTTLQTYGLILDEAAENNWGRNASLYYEDYMPYDGHEPISSHLRYGEAGPYWETASENLPGALEKRRPNSQ
jgi:glycogen(starch) synthase